MLCVLFCVSCHAACIGLTARITCTLSPAHATGDYLFWPPRSVVTACSLFWNRPASATASWSWDRSSCRNTSTCSSPFPPFATRKMGYPHSFVRRGNHRGLKPGAICDGLRSPFGFAQGRPLKRRSSTVVSGFVEGSRMKIPTQAKTWLEWDTRQGQRRAADRRSPLSPKVPRTANQTTCPFTFHDRFPKRLNVYRFQQR
jgi:hypothetical protein